MTITAPASKWVIRTYNTVMIALMAGIVAFSWRGIQNIEAKPIIQLVPVVVANLGQTEAVTAVPQSAPADASILKHAPTPNYFVRPFGLVSYNGQTKCPRWTLEELTKKHLAGKAKRTSLDFFADTEIPVEFRASPSCYAESGFDKGHAASAANHEHDMAEMKSTFTLINCMPQWPECNRLIVLQGEDMAREFAEVDEFTTVYRVVAPCWLSDIHKIKEGHHTSTVPVLTIGKDEIWVPTHVAFSVLIVKSGKVVQMRGWLVPNMEKYPAAATFDTYKKCVDDIEIASGLQLWKGLPPEMQDAMEK